MELSVLELRASLTRESFDLADLARSVLEKFSPLMERARIRVETQIPGALVMQGDGDQIRRVLINLLDNAVQYNVEGGGAYASRSPKKTQPFTFACTTPVPEYRQMSCRRFSSNFTGWKNHTQRNTAASGRGCPIGQEIFRFHRGTMIKALNP